jgi:hypothetical protein
MSEMHVILIAGFIASGTACIITSNVIFYQILSDVNSRRPRAEQFSFILVRARVFKITGEHSGLYPGSQKRKLMYLWAAIGFASFFAVFLSGFIG